MPDPARPTPGEALRAADQAVGEILDRLEHLAFNAKGKMRALVPAGDWPVMLGAEIVRIKAHREILQRAERLFRHEAMFPAALPPEGRHPEEPVLNWEQGYQQICEVAAKNLERAERAEAAFSVLEPIDVGYAAALIEDRIASEGPVNQPLLTERARRLRQLQYALNLTGAEGRAPTEPQSLIPLNEAQARAAKDWAADDRLWTTQETVAFNLRTFARVILKANLLAAPTETPPSDGAKLEVRTLKPSAPPETPARLQEYLTSRKALLNAMIPMDEKAAHTKWHRLNELEQLEAALVSPVDPQEP